jgi:ComEC/Rec2-related protein
MYEGVFTPQKVQYYSSFFDKKIKLLGKLETDQGSFDICLFNPRFSDKIYKKSRITVEIIDQSCKLQAHRFLQENAYLYAFRQKFLNFIEKKLQTQKGNRSKSLFLALLTGQIEEKLMMLQFKDYGLSHLLALSGFHLNLILSILSFFLKKILRHNLRMMLGLVILSIYALFIGQVPSILRAFCSLVFHHLFSFFTLEKKPYDVFGLSLMSVTLLCPDKLLSAGFVLSFSATFAIISFEKINVVVSSFMKAKTLYEKVIRSWMQILSLQIWITLFSFPFLLFYFQSFHFGSIFYNLLIPPLIVIGMWSCFYLLFFSLFFKSFSQPLISYFYGIYDFLFLIIKKPLIKDSSYIRQDLGLIPLAVLIFFLLQLVFFLEYKKSKAI